MDNQSFDKTPSLEWVKEEYVSRVSLVKIRQRLTSPAAWLGCCVFGAGFAAKYAGGLGSRRARLWRFQQRDPRGPDRLADDPFGTPLRRRISAVDLAHDPSNCASVLHHGHSRYAR